MNRFEVALVDYARTHPLFTAEDAWRAHPGFDDLVPSQKGMTFRHALILPGHVVPQGVAKAQNLSAKGRAVTVWKSLLCPDEASIVPAQSVLSDILSDINQRKITVLEGLQKAYSYGNRGW